MTPQSRQALSRPRIRPTEPILLCISYDQIESMCRNGVENFSILDVMALTLRQCFCVGMTVDCQTLSNDIVEKVFVYMRRCKRAHTTNDQLWIPLIGFVETMYRFSCDYTYIRVSASDELDFCRNKAIYRCVN